MPFDFQPRHCTGHPTEEMNDASISRLVFKALEFLRPIQTARVSMFDLNNPYTYPPFLRFRFAGKLKDDKICERVRNAIDCFEGKLKWTLTSREGVENYVIKPMFVNKDEEVRSSNKKDYFVSVLGEELYRKKIDDAIEDIPKLAKAVSSC